LSRTTLDPRPTRRLPHLTSYYRLSPTISVVARSDDAVAGAIRSISWASEGLAISALATIARRVATVIFDIVAAPGRRPSWHRGAGVHGGVPSRVVCIRTAGRRRGSPGP